MIDRGDIRQAIDRCSNIWASLPGAGYGQFEHKADSLIGKIQRSGRNVREIDVWAVTAIISALVICIIVCLSWAVNHYRDNAITYKAQRDKNARELKLANAAITDMQMRQRDVAALDAKYEGVIDAKAEKWCSAMMLPLVVVGCTSAVCQSVRESHHRSPARIMQPPPTGRHRWTGLFHPQREADVKTTGRNPEALMSSADRAVYTMGNSCNYCEQYTRRKYIKCLKWKPSESFTNVYAGFLF